MVNSVNKVFDDLIQIVHRLRDSMVSQLKAETGSETIRCENELKGLYKIRSEIETFAFDLELNKEHCALLKENVKPIEKVRQVFRQYKHVHSSAQLVR